jgi:hypothetical protein
MIACGSTGNLFSTAVDGGGNRDGSLEGGRPNASVADGGYDISAVPDASVADGGYEVGAIPVDGAADQGPVSFPDASFVDASPCTDDAVAPESGTPFDCTWPGSNPGPTCWSGSQVCVLWSAGQIRHPDTSYPTPGCQPFPCGCGATPSCACLGSLQEPCTCSDDAGAVMVYCVFP